jgi:signal recognition particle subunit SRP54
MLQQLRSGGGIQEMMKAMMGGGQIGEEEIAQMQRMMNQMGMGGRGMPDLSALMRSMGGR